MHIESYHVAKRVFGEDENGYEGSTIVYPTEKFEDDFGPIRNRVSQQLSSLKHTPPCSYFCFTFVTHTRCI